MQRMAGYWRYVNKRTYNAMIRTNKLWDWSTGEKLPEVEVDENDDLGEDDGASLGGSTQVETSPEDIGWGDETDREQIVEGKTSPGRSIKSSNEPSSSSDDCSGSNTDVTTAKYLLEKIPSKKDDRVLSKAIRPASPVKVVHVTTMPYHTISKPKLTESVENLSETCSSNGFSLLDPEVPAPREEPTESTQTKTRRQHPKRQTIVTTEDYPALGSNEALTTTATLRKSYQSNRVTVTASTQPKGTKSKFPKALSPLKDSSGTSISSPSEHKSVASWSSVVKGT